MSGLADVLVRIVADRRSRLAGEGEPRLPVAGAAGGAPLAAGNNALLGALALRRGRAVIAEVKMGSPRLGSLVGRLDPDRQARQYAASGAAALSVVVEPDHFGGSYELLARCRQVSGLPALAKDFVIDLRQLEWARAAGADAVLLIAALYGAEELRGWAAAARRLGLAPLVEIHDRDDLAKLAGASWELVGVNNRDLRNFEVDIEASLGMAARLPEPALKVAESGISSEVDVQRLAGAGFDAFLVGEFLLLADDPAARLRSLLAPERPGRMSRTRVKICGVTRVEDAELAVELGADFLGLNFYPASPRCLDLTTARRIADAVVDRVVLVGVTVNAGARRIEEISPLVELLQFHGEESPEAMQPWAERAIKVLRPEAEEAGLAARYPDVWGFLLEPRRPGRGGSGKPWDYASATLPDTHRPIFVAGGIDPDNVRVAAAGVWGIDVCSGVESKPGVKDAGLMKRLFSELRRVA